VKRRTRRTLVAATIVAAAAVATAAALGSAVTGPTSSQSPYVVRSQPGVVTKAILTVGDSVAGYRMVGIPDGLGAFDNGDGTFTLLMNHELRPGTGAVRAHGANGAFVSKWTIDADTLEVLEGEDLIRHTLLWTPAGYVESTTQLNRLCSADLPAKSAFWNQASGKGYDGRLFMDGEESGAEGRGFAHALDGRSWELPALGRFSWENSVANPSTGDTTVTVGTDDSTPGQVYVYVGTKTATGSPVERAGLTNGKLYGVKVPGVATEPAAGIPAGRFELADLGSRVGTTGAALEADSDAAGVTRFLRPEDGSWDPTNPNVFYFVTTNAFTAPSRLWRLTFDDVRNPTADGRIEMALDGTEGQKMLDNMTVDDRGNVLIQEDVGGNDHLGRIFEYFPESDTLVEVAPHDENRFAPGAPNFLTNDEESSGIIPAPFLGEGWYLLDVQAHYATDAETVEGGQLLALHVPPGRKK
jgi:Bacterial protein of unknown function (DUF839)